MKEMMYRISEAKNTEKLNRAQKCLILGPQNLGSRGIRPPTPPGSTTFLLNLFCSNSILAELLQ